MNDTHAILPQPDKWYFIIKKIKTIVAWAKKQKHLKKIIAGLLGGTIIATMGWIIVSGSYPVAIVNGKVISSAQLQRNYNFSEKAKAYISQDQTEAQAKVLERLIENSIIEEELKKEMGNSVLQQKIDEKINLYKNIDDLNPVMISTLGVSGQDFLESIVIPEIEKKLIIASLTLKDANIKDWLIQEKQNARVRIFSPAFIWKDGRVVVK